LQQKISKSHVDTSIKYPSLRCSPAAVDERECGYDRLQPKSYCIRRGAFGRRVVLFFVPAGDRLAYRVAQAHPVFLSTRFGLDDTGPNPQIRFRPRNDFGSQGAFNADNSNFAPPRGRTFQSPPFVTGWSFGSNCASAVWNG
jgi:hypothetical protein